MTHTQIIASLLNIKPSQVEAAITLLDKGNTVPFISRYRKEMTASLDDEQIRVIADEIVRLRAIDERRETILKSINEQGKLTDELKTTIEDAKTLTVLEDLYAPYRPKRRTRALMAQEKGLAPLAELLLSQPLDLTPEEAAQAYINDDVPTIEDAMQGARDIVAERISENANIRSQTREKALKFAVLTAEKIEGAVDEKSTYRTYYEFQGRVDRIQPHQLLAIARGEKEGILRVHVNISDRDWKPAVRREIKENLLSPFAKQLEEAIEDAASRLLLPSIARDVRRSLSEASESHAIQVFGTNLRALLGQPPLEGHTVLAIDPGFRTGSKVAVVDATGKLLDTGTIYPHPPQNEWGASLKKLEEMIEHHNVTLIAVGNGTASRETEKLVASLTHDMPSTKYLIVSEAGASVYSASPLARAEFPNLDVSIRGAVSIARRAQDPLAELVKIDPKAIGVGM